MSVQPPSALALSIPMCVQEVMDKLHQAGLFELYPLPELHPVLFPEGIKDSRFEYCVIGVDDFVHRVRQLEDTLNCIASEHLKAILIGSVSEVPPSLSACLERVQIPHTYVCCKSLLTQQTPEAQHRFARQFTLARYSFPGTIKVCRRNDMPLIPRSESMDDKRKGFASIAEGTVALAIV